jgi:hypothetical protein
MPRTIGIRSTPSGGDISRCELGAENGQVRSTGAGPASIVDAPLLPGAESTMQLIHLDPNVI